MKPKVTGVWILTAMEQNESEIGEERMKEMRDLNRLLSFPLLIFIKIYVWIFCW